MKHSQIEEAYAALERAATNSPHLDPAAPIPDFNGIQSFEKEYRARLDREAKLRGRFERAAAVRRGRPILQIADQDGESLKALEAIVFNREVPPSDEK